MQKLVIFGTYYDVMGLKNFRRKVIDPDYKTILEALMHVHDVEFIFEEASGFGPSVASEMATGRYLDIDSETTEQALSQSAEDTETNFLPQILDNSRLRLTARKLGLAAQKRRESCSVTKIRAQ